MPNDNDTIKAQIRQKLNECFDLAAVVVKSGEVDGDEADIVSECTKDVATARERKKEVDKPE